MTDEKEKDVQTDADAEEIVVDTEEEDIAADADAEDVVADAEEEVIMTDADAEDVVADAEEEVTVTYADAEDAAPVSEEPKKEGRFKRFFKTRKLAIGVTILAILLVANVSVLGLNMHKGKGFRDHGGGKTVEREYTKSPDYEKGDKGSHAEKAPRAEGDACTERAPKGEGEGRGKGEPRTEKGPDAEEAVQAAMVAKGAEGTGVEKSPCISLMCQLLFD